MRQQIEKSSNSLNLWQLPELFIIIIAIVACLVGLNEVLFLLSFSIWKVVWLLQLDFLSLHLLFKKLSVIVIVLFLVFIFNFSRLFVL